MSFGQWASDYFGVPLEERFNFNPLTYFLYSGIDGAWFDPEDMSTMFQDAAGTTPVTALEQPVGKWLDKSGNGNHATQSITASRPTLSARYNRLLNSATLSTQSVTTVAAQYTLSFTGTGSVTLSGSATGTLAGTGANNRVSLAFTPTAGTLTLTVTGSVTLAMLAFGTLTTYQAITTATSYDSAGWSRHLRFDGIDDYLNLPYMGLYANGSVSVVCSSSVQLSASNTYLISERNGANAQPKYLPIRKNASSTMFDTNIVNDSTVTFDSTGTTINTSLASVVSLIDYGNSVRYTVNAAIKPNETYTRINTVTLNNTTIGVSVSTTNSAYFSGNLYGLIITKSALSDTDRKRCEQFLASRLSQLGVTLS